MLSIVIVLIATIGLFIARYTGNRPAFFANTLSTAGKILLFCAVAGGVLLLLPYSFWRTVSKLLAYRPKMPVAAEKQTTNDETTSPTEEHSETRSVDVPAQAGNVVSIVQSSAPAMSGDASPQQPIVLKLKRSQKPAMTGMIYMLDARIDLSAEVRSLITTHKLGNRVIYESEARQRHAANARGHLDNSRSDTPILAPAGDQAKGLGRTLWKLARAGVSAARASLALRITVSSLMAGVHVECKSMEELLEAEAAIREAKENLEGFLETAKTFDGREEIS